jgi:hypothetical protein
MISKTFFPGYHLNQAKSNNIDKNEHGMVILAFLSPLISADFVILLNV